MDLASVLDIAGRTDSGKVREHNEDSIGEDSELGIIVLADGMGGYQGGEVASAIAVNEILAHLNEHLLELRPGSIDRKSGLFKESLLARKAVDRANKAIVHMSESNPRYRGMGTTLVLGLFFNDRIAIAHVGDSRMYRYRNGQLDPMTRDHTLLQDLVDRGFYTAEEANRSLNKNLVTRALGVDNNVTIDIAEADVQVDDLYLLCSDGLNDMISDTQILEVIETYPKNLQVIADKLVDKANEHGGKDNVSVVLAKTTGNFPAPPLSWHEKLLERFKQD